MWAEMSASWFLILSFMIFICVQGVTLFAASCGSRQKYEIPSSYFLRGSDTLCTKSCFCYYYFRKKCCFSVSMLPEGPNKCIYNYLKYLFPPSDTVFDGTTRHLGWISCEIPKFPAGNTHRPAGKVTPCPYPMNPWPMTLHMTNAPGNFIWACHGLVCYSWPWCHFPRGYYPQEI